MAASSSACVEICAVAVLTLNDNISRHPTKVVMRKAGVLGVFRGSNFMNEVEDE